MFIQSPHSMGKPDDLLGSKDTGLSIIPRNQGTFDTIPHVLLVFIDGFHQTDIILAPKLY